MSRTLKNTALIALIVLTGLFGASYGLAQTTQPIDAELQAISNDANILYNAAKTAQSQVAADAVTILSLKNQLAAATQPPTTTTVHNAGGKATTVQVPDGTVLNGDQYLGSVFNAIQKWGVVLGNRVTANGIVGVSDSGGVQIKGDSVVINGCTTNGCGESGLGGTATNTTINNPISNGNNTKDYPVQNEAGGGKFVSSDNLVFNNGTYLNNRGFGLWLDYQCKKVTVEGGTYSGSTVGGANVGQQVANIRFEESTGPSLVDNVTSAVAPLQTTAIEFADSANASVTNCTITGQIGLIRTGRANVPAVSNVTITHNRFTNAGVYWFTGVTKFTLDYNNYLRNDGGPVAWVDGKGYTFAQLQALGYEAHGTLNGVGGGVTTAPATQPTSPTVTTQPVNGFQFGTNTASGQESLPGTIPTMQALGMGYVRYFQWGAFTSPPVAAMWVDSQQYNKLGIKTIVCLNFQNSVPVNASPAQADWVKYLSSIPPPSQTGVWAFEIGNELGVTGGYSGNATQYTATLKDAYTVLHAAGYKVICGNVYYGSPWPDALASAGALKYCDYFGRHAYDIDAATALVDYTAICSWAQSHSVAVCCTEVGLHANAGSLANWSTETQKLYTGLRSMNGIFVQFPLYVTNTTAGPQGLLLTNGQPNQPFYAAAVAALSH